MASLTADAASDLFRKPPDRHIDVGNGAVAYRKVGAGPDVVFSHGWPVTAATFRRLLPYLTEHVSCHLIDLPGAGDSHFDRTTTISVTSHVAALRRAVDELGLTSFGVIGHDSGGMIARLAFAGDARVHGWGLIATEQPPKASWRLSSFLAIRVVPRFERLLGFIVVRRRLRRNTFILGDAFADKNLLDGEFEEFFLRPLHDDPERQWAAGEFGRNFDLGLLEELTACHRKINVPVQLVWGADDPFFPVERTRAMIAEFSGPVDLEVISNAKLFVHEEFPERTADAIRRTIRG
ncbi:MAG: alpha/beta fold hydrolase [Acidimicrobiales bacterium]